MPSPVNLRLLPGSLVLPEPRNVPEAREAFPYDRLLSVASVQTRNAHWESFLSFLSGLGPQERPLSPSILVLYAEECLLELQRAADYLCTTKCRGLQLGLFGSSSLELALLDKAQRRAVLAVKAQPHSKAPPVFHDALHNCSFKQILLVSLWANIGARVSAFKTLTFDCFPPLEVLQNSKADFVKFSYDKSKTNAFKGYVPRKVILRLVEIDAARAPGAPRLLPVSQFNIDTLLCTLGSHFKSHSFRRALAISIRVYLARVGLETEKEISAAEGILPRVNKLFGWKTNMLFEYSRDFKDFMYRSFITEDVIFNYILEGYFGSGIYNNEVEN